MANTFIFDDDEQPDTGGGMLPEPDDDQQPEEGEGSNRTFTIILIGLGVALLIAMLCVGGFFVNRMFSGNNQAALASTNDFQTQEAIAAETQLALQASPTLEPSQTSTETPTTTPVVVIFATETPAGEQPTQDPALATAAVLQTQLAQTQQAQPATTTTAIPGRGTPTRSASGSGGVATPTASIPKTGFAEDIGLPALGILTVLLLGVIFLVRRLRTAPSR